MQEIIFNWLTTLPYGHYLTNRLVQAGVVILLSIFLAWLVIYVFTKYFEKFAKNTKTKVDDLIVERTRKPLFYFILAYGLKIATNILNVNGVISKIVNSLMALVFIFILLRALDVIIETWGATFAKKTKSNIDDVLLPLFHKAARVVFIVIALMWLLKIWGIDIGPYLAGVGISGIVLGFALQDALKNIFGGITLILDKTYQIGDKVKLESGDVGTIHDIGLRSTKLITFDNEIVYIPNGYLANSRVQNYTRPTPKVKSQVMFGVEYGTDVQKVKDVVMKVMKQNKGVLSDPAPGVLFLEMGDSALSFKAFFWVEKWDQAFGVKLELTEAIYNALNKAKIGIPFPTQTVYVKK